MPMKPRLLKKKSVSSELLDDTAEQFVVDELNEKKFETKFLPLSKIVFWENQPRHSLLVNKDDVIRGYILKSDPVQRRKIEQFEKIIIMAQSQNDIGLQQNPVVYDLPGGEGRIISGHRRTLAFIFRLFHVDKDGSVKINESPNLDLLDHARITVSAYSRKPSKDEILKIGISTNTLYEGLSLSEIMQSFIDLSVCVEENNFKPLTSEVIAQTLNISRSSSYSWLKVSQQRSNEWVNKATQNIVNEVKQMSFRNLMILIETSDDKKEQCYNSFFDKPTSKPVSLGVATNTDALKSLILKNSSADFLDSISHYDWTKKGVAKKAFAAFIAHWEELHVSNK